MVVMLTVRIMIKVTVIAAEVEKTGSRGWRQQ